MENPRRIGGLFAMLIGAVTAMVLVLEPSLPSAERLVVTSVSVVAFIIMAGLFWSSRGEAVEGPSLTPRKGQVGGVAYCDDCRLVAEVEASRGSGGCPRCGKPMSGPVAVTEGWHKARLLWIGAWVVMALLGLATGSLLLLVSGAAFVVIHLVACFSIISFGNVSPLVIREYGKAPEWTRPSMGRRLALEFGLALLFLLVLVFRGMMAG